MKNVVREFDTGSVKVRALDGVDLEIEKGDYVAILGPSGSGKSTLMNIIGLLDPPTSGEYILEGESVLGYHDQQLTRSRREKIGFVFQKFNLLPKLNAQQNVELPLLFQGIDKQEAAAKAGKMLEVVGLGDRLNHKPNELSGGQQQRVAIARALVAGPPVILADEPTGALDSKTSEEIIKTLDKLNAMGNTVIMITHDRKVAKRAKKILYMSDGRINNTYPWEEA
jgi:putative ABC transport system ATP-binding protein